MAGQRINLDAPMWDQSSFVGRLKYFFWVTDPRTVLAPDAELEKAKELLKQYRLGQEPKGTSEDQIIYARKLYESAYHPDSGDLMNVYGRMSFQVPGGMAITGVMLQFYKTVPAVVFWQWVNQSFNAFVNYTNRNAESPITPQKIGVAYAMATTSALVTALGLKAYLQKAAAPFMQRFVPFAAVAAANVANIPLMRQGELTDGVAVFDENGNKVTESRMAAVKGISQVVLSRIVMAAPGMIILPFIMQKLETYPWMQRLTFLHAPMQITMVGAFLTFMVPISCSFFPQKCSLSVATIQKFEPEAYSKLLKSTSSIPEFVYFNKGL